MTAKKIIKVANIIEEAKLGGPQVRMMQVSAALKGEVDTIIIMPKQNSNLFSKKCEELGVPYITLPISRITRELKVALQYVFYSLVEIYKIYSFLNSNNIDLVHVSGGSWQYKGVIAAKLSRKSVIWHLNDSSMPKIFRMIFSKLSKMSNGYIYASIQTQEYYRHLVRNTAANSFVIPAPVDTCRFNPNFISKGADKELIHSWEGFTVVGTVANINPIKGLEDVIKVAEDLNKSIDNVLFIVIGSLFENQSKYFNKLKELSCKLKTDNVLFLGSREDTRELLNRMDIYLCSSISEASPMAVWEAMSMKKPIVSTDVGDVPVYIKNNFNGFISKCKDTKSISSNIQTLIQNKELAKEFGERSRAIAVNNLDIKICAKKHLNMYKSSFIK